MTLNEAISARSPLAIDLGGGNDRGIACAWLVSGGFLFADVYWREAGWHPMDFVRGEVAGTGPWTVGGAQIRVIDRGDPCVLEYIRWIAFLASPEASGYTPEAAGDEAKLLLEG